MGLIASQGSLIYGGVAAETLYPVAPLNGQKLHRHFSATRSTGVPWVISCLRSCANTCTLVLNSRAEAYVSVDPCNQVVAILFCRGDSTSERMLPAQTKTK